MISAFRGYWKRYITKFVNLWKYMYVFIGAEIKTGLCSGKGKGELYMYCLQRPVVEYGYMCEAHKVNKVIARLIIL